MAFLSVYLFLQVHRCVQQTRRHKQIIAIVIIIIIIIHSHKNKNIQDTEVAF